MTAGPVSVLLPPEVIAAYHDSHDSLVRLDESAADDLLSAWVAAWHPCVLTATGRLPIWLPADHFDPTAGGGTTIVPACCAHRVSAAEPGPDPRRWVSGIRGAAGIAAAAAGRAAEGGPDLPGAAFAADFHALGLTVLLADLLARRMRSALDLEMSGFAAAATAAAAAAVAGQNTEVRERLEECFGCLEAARARYYPVDVWLIDLVLLQGAKAANALASELEDDAPLGLVAAGDDLAALAACPETLDRLRERCALGNVSACGGRDRDDPLGPFTPEQIAMSFDRGLLAWRTHVGVEPRVYAQIGGGGSGLLPQILAGLGYVGAIWSRFDGTPLPEIGTGLVRWRGPGTAAIETLAGRPVEARLATTILELPDLIGTAMDHDHVAAVCFARHAGTGGPWHRLLRRAAGWGAALGTFVTPAEFFRRVAGSGRDLRLGTDAFSTTPVSDADPAPAGGPGPGSAAVVAAEAARIVAHAEERTALFEVGSDDPAMVSSPPVVRGWRPGWLAGFRGAAADAGHVLDNGCVRVEVHPVSGGVLSLRRPGDRTNRLSQRLSLRPRVGLPATAAGLDRPAMVADTIVRTGDRAAGRIESRGRFQAADGRTAGTFRQTVTLAANSGLVLLDVEVGPAAAAGGLPVCQFAWHENEDLELRRSVHAQAVPTRRMRFTAEHFVELRGGSWNRAADGTVTIAAADPGAYEWFEPHVLETMVRADTTCRLAVGLDLPRPWDLGFALRAGSPPAALPAVGPRHVRVAVERIEWHEGRLARARIALVESAGVRGEVRLPCTRPIDRATALDARGCPRQDVAVAVEGPWLVVSLRAYEWLPIDLEYAG